MAGRHIRDSENCGCRLEFPPLSAIVSRNLIRPRLNRALLLETNGGRYETHPFRVQQASERHLWSRPDSIQHAHPPNSPGSNGTGNRRPQEVPPHTPSICQGSRSRAHRSPRTSGKQSCRASVRRVAFCIGTFSIFDLMGCRRDLTAHAGSRKNRRSGLHTRYDSSGCLVEYRAR